MKDFVINYFSFNGRYNRQKFLIIGLLFSIILWVFSFLAFLNGAYKTVIFVSILGWILWVFPLVKRFHDINFNGWWVILLILPQILIAEPFIEMFLEDNLSLTIPNIITNIISIISVIGVIIGTIAQFVLPIILAFVKWTEWLNRFWEDPLKNIKP